MKKNRGKLFFFYKNKTKKREKNNKEKENVCVIRNKP
jgi:hypothetical protein